MEELTGMLEDALDDEDEAIEVYEGIIEYIKASDDPNIVSILAKIEAIKQQEEEHADTIELLLKELE